MDLKTLSVASAYEVAEELQSANEAELSMEALKLALIRALHKIDLLEDQVSDLQGVVYSSGFP